MKSVLSFVLICTSLFIHAQDWVYEAPDYDLIKRDIADEESHLFYDSLLVRFQRGDTTMSLEELRHVYYGYIHQDAYSPYKSDGNRDQLREIQQKDSLTTEDFLKVLELTGETLSDDPFNLRVMSTAADAAYFLEDTATLMRMVFQYNAIIDVILSSGYGLEEENAFYVISVSHEYVFLGALGFQFGGQQSLIGQCDKLELQDNEAGIEAFYFNVSASLNSMSKLFGE